MNRSPAYTCRNCSYWRAGAPGDMQQPAPLTTEAEIGVCESSPPILFKMEKDDAAISYQPLTHASRSCVDFAAASDGDGPQQGRVRQLFPVTPAPAA